MKYERLEGSSVQHDSVAGVDSNSMSLTSGSLFKHSAAWQQLFFDHSQLNPICTIRHKISYIKIRYDYIKPLCKVVTPSIKMDYID